ncbi:uncharacterized protein [Dendrobates tinctorius]|uniref:uncharacterized protein n=1 Tax=Dendrobates tinctorius TaxID=92724 RepID=UPI003CC96A9B
MKTATRREMKMLIVIQLMSMNPHSFLCTRSLVLVGQIWLVLHVTINIWVQLQQSSPKKKLCVQSVEKFILKTTTSQKEHFDELIAKFIFATNSSFRLVEHPLFVQMIEGIRPGYKPPSRFDISGKHLQAVYDIERAACTKYLKDKVVNMSLDGWSNIHNDPIICTCVTTEDGETYLTDTIDTSGNSHTAEYLLEIAKNSIHQCQEQFGCKVRSLVTDNASNVAKMRAELAQDDTNVITYGCSAHLLHLLAKDLHILGVKEHVVEIVKYFRNNHFAHATYKEMGGLKLVLPQDVRWNTLADCLELFINNWSKLLPFAKHIGIKLMLIYEAKY